MRIGDGSWLGYGTVVLPGATIGRHVVIGANSVVRGEIPDFCVAAGNPAKVISRCAPAVDRPDGPSELVGESRRTSAEVERGDAVGHVVVGGEAR